MQLLMTLFKALLSSKVVAFIGFVGAILGAISDPHWSNLIPANFAALAVTIGTPVAWLGRQLVDVDGNGIPDFIDALLGKAAGSKGGHTRLALLVVLTAAGGIAGALLLLPRI